MSDGGGKNRRPGRTLLPEVLPAPPAGGGSAASQPPDPRERVAARADLLLQRFRGLAPTAGAALLSLHCSGYGVVDPMPPPAQQCTTLPDPFSSLHATALHDTAVDAGLAPVRLMLQAGQFPAYPMLTGFQVQAVRVQGGTLLDIFDEKGPFVSSGNNFQIRIEPAAPNSTLLIDVDVGCGSATTTKHFRLMYQPPPATLFVEDLG